jgi:outer membrane receptor for ferrienterochelin and colicins
MAAVALLIAAPSARAQTTLSGALQPLHGPAQAQAGQPGEPPAAETPPPDRAEPDPDAATSREAEADAASEPAVGADASDAEEQAGEVIVIDSRSEKPLGQAVGAVEVVDRAAIRARGARNVADALRGRVGLEIVPALRGTAVRAQGLDPAYVLVLIDGLPAIGRIDGALDLDRLSVGDVERIEVIKGPSSALYGSDALGGVINVVTRDADRPLSAEASATYGSRDRIDATATAAARRRAGDWRLATRAALGMRRSDGWDLDASTPGTEGSAERAGDGAVRVAAERGPWRVALGGDYLRQDLRSVDTAGLAVFDRRNVAETAAGTASATFKPRDGTSVAATLRHSIFHDQFLFDQQDSGQLDDYEVTDERLTSAALVANSLVSPSHLITAGVDGSAEGLESERLSDDGSRERLGVYAQDEWMVSGRPQVILVPGARLDLDSQFGVHGTPKLNARWDVTEQVIARGSFGLGYRAPDFRQLLLRFENPGVGYLVVGNPDLDPETSVGGTLSVEVEPIERVAIAAQGYWNEVDDLIVIELAEPAMGDDEALYQYSNVASARTRGVELQARGRLGRYLVASIGYTLSDTLDRDADRELPDRARHRGSFELRAMLPWRLTVATHGELVGKRSFFADMDNDGDDERLRADRYAWLGARAEWGVVDYLSVFAGIDNIADAGDTEFLPLAPRSFYGGVRGTYESADDPSRAVLP